MNEYNEHNESNNGLNAAIANRANNPMVNNNNQGLNPVRWNFRSRACGSNERPTGGIEWETRGGELMRTTVVALVSSLLYFKEEFIIFISFALKQTRRSI